MNKIFLSSQSFSKTSSSNIKNKDYDDNFLNLSSTPLTNTYTNNNCKLETKIDERENKKYNNNFNYNKIFKNKSYNNNYFLNIEQNTALNKTYQIIIIIIKKIK